MASWKCVEFHNSVKQVGNDQDSRTKKRHVLSYISTVYMCARRAGQRRPLAKFYSTTFCCTGQADML